MSCRPHLFKWIVWVACATHLYWGTVILLTHRSPPPNATHVNAIHHLLTVFPNAVVLGLVLIGVALGASISLIRREGVRRRRDVLYIVPQQGVMIFSALAAIQSSAMQTFADGAPYPWYFISVDQCWHVFNGIGHTLALWQMYLLPESITMDSSKF
jgi:hypothetical protein